MINFFRLVNEGAQEFTDSRISSVWHDIFFLKLFSPIKKNGVMLHGSTPLNLTPLRFTLLLFQ